MEGESVATNASQGIALLECFVAFTCLGGAMFLLKRRLGISPSCSSTEARKLTYTEEFSRLALRWRDPQWRDYGMLLLAGKALGIAVLFGMIAVVPMLIRAVSGTVVYAQPPA